MNDAIEYSKRFNIKVYPIGAISLESNSREDLIKAKEDLQRLARETGGKYFDYTEYTTDEISKEIDQLTKSSIITESYITKNDLPEKIFPYILWLIPILFILDWRVRI